MHLIVKFVKKINGKVMNRMLIGLLIVSLLFGGAGQIIMRSNSDAATVYPGMLPGTVPDYFGTIPNYANSPLPVVVNGAVTTGSGIRKFVDSLPGLNKANANNLGNYIPVGIPDTVTYPGTDYYEIDLIEYTQKMHSDLPPTKLRGYMQVNTTDATISTPSYLGPTIVATKDRPVRIKFTNRLPIGAGGDLFIPVDTTLMGAGLGPNGGTEMYTQNRATLHLHGGMTPWISDGTPHQWITPAGENTSYPKGVSVQNVPDMPDPGPGAMTFFYTNQQSARLMFYHDHAYGLTRLNVYAGEAAGYIIQDQTEKDLIASGVIPADEIPLIIQDKTFVPETAQLVKEDPTWDISKWGDKGSLWFPHVYMTNQNPYDNTGANPMGRWDYGPWFWPPYTGLQFGPVANPLFGQPGQPPMNPGVPNVSLVPEAFMDTPVVNGTAYPYLDVQPKPYRFRILNAANDRFFNLQLYQAASNGAMWNPDGSLLDANAGEVSMVDAIKGPITPLHMAWPATWPTDGRAGGVPDPDPLKAGPNMIQIGTEGGLLPNAVEIPNQPINYVYNRRDIIVLSVSDKSLFLGPAERADVVIDFTKYAGKTLILYNDAPAPVPAFDPRNDYYTGDPDQTSTGGAPSTLPGYGPNTRTIMQIKVAAAPVAPDPAASSFGFGLNSVTVTNAGTGYTTPAVSTTGGDGTGATATATGVVDKITVASSTSDFTSAPVVAITGGGASTAATANATMTLSGLTIVSGGSGYAAAPAVTITDSLGAGTGATAATTIDSTGVVNSISLLTFGSGYVSPVVTIASAGALPATTATATATGTVTDITLATPGVGYVTAPSVALTGGGLNATATASATLSIASVILTNPGSGYAMVAPTVTITDATGTGTGAAAVANIASPSVVLPLAIPAAFVKSQPPLIVPPGKYVRIQDTAMTFTPAGSTTPLTMKMEPKAIQELFTMDYGRMNATLAVELPNTNARIQTTIPFGYIDPATEFFKDNITAVAPVAGDGTQMWKITHNGVDTHAIHFHLFDVQVINRVGWDGAIRPPDANETGWKDTVRMNPLEDCIVVFRPVSPKLKFGVPDSIRPMDPTSPLGTTTQFTGINPKTGNPITVINALFNYGWEYVWHCHLLGHEENDMMRPMVLNVARNLPAIPVLTLARNVAGVNLAWTDGTPPATSTTLGNPANEIGTLISRAVFGRTGKLGAYTQIATALANATAFVDTTADQTLKYRYQVTVYNAAGKVTSLAKTVGALIEAPINLTATLSSGRVFLQWIDNATNETGFVLERAANGGAFTQIFAPAARTGTGSASYTDTTVVSGTSYEYRIKAVSTVLPASSAYSNTVSIGVASPVAAPTNLAATRSGTTVTLIWQDNAGNETGFMVERAMNGSAFTTIATPALKAGTGGSVSYADTAVTTGHTYDYRVRAVLNTTLSAYPNPVTVIVP